METKTVWCIACGEEVKISTRGTYLSTDWFETHTACACTQANSVLSKEWFANSPEELVLKRLQAIHNPEDDPLKDF